MYSCTPDYLCLILQMSLNKNDHTYNDKHVLELTIEDMGQNEHTDWDMFIDLLFTIVDVVLLDERVKEEVAEAREQDGDGDDGYVVGESMGSN